jgi:hypothetical protein
MESGKFVENKKSPQPRNDILDWERGSLTTEASPVDVSLDGIKIPAKENHCHLYYPIGGVNFFGNQLYIFRIRNSFFHCKTPFLLKIDG